MPLDQAADDEWARFVRLPVALIFFSWLPDRRFCFRRFEKKVRHVAGAKIPSAVSGFCFGCIENVKIVAGEKVRVRLADFALDGLKKVKIFFSGKKSECG